MVEAIRSDCWIKHGGVFRREDDAPEFMPVLRAGGKNEAGVIKRIGTAHDDLGVERIDDWSGHVSIDEGMPALRAIRVEGKEMA